MNTLKQYVAEILEDALADYEGDRAACLHDAMQGTTSGWCGDLIYFHDIKRLFTEHRMAIVEALTDYEEQVGEFPSDPAEDFNSAELLKALAGSSMDNDGILMAACRALRFAVEWETHAYASLHNIEV
jgi:hypothetical protein